MKKLNDLFGYTCSYVVYFFNLKKRLLSSSTHIPKIKKLELFSDPI